MGNGLVIAWGSYDHSKPRVRLLLEALRRRSALAAEINVDVWRGIEDKSVAGKRRILAAYLRLTLAYPSALAKLLRRPSGESVLLPYPGIPDILVVAPFAKLRRQKIILDAFIPFYDTIVGDRAMIAAGSVRARLIRALEKLALRWADVILVDTDQHGDFFAAEYGVPRDRFVTVLVGAEPLFGQPVLRQLPAEVPARGPIILFYGQLIPLHGLSTLLGAVKQTRAEPFHWVVVGRGQEEPLLKAALDQLGPKITWIPWVDYEVLPALIARATVCLGVFGASGKAERVIPNKLFQALAAGKPVITRTSPAVEELARRFPNTVMTVPPNDAAALAAAVRRALSAPERLQPLPPAERQKLGPEQGVADLLRRISAG